AQRGVQRAIENGFVDHDDSSVRCRHGRHRYPTPVPLEPGLVGVVEMVVTDDDTAPAFQSGSVPVLATGRVVGLAESATVLAVGDLLADGTTTVGYRVQLDHLAPTAVGSHVKAEAILESVRGRRLTFRVSVTDARGLVAAGKITRVVVERARFLAKAAGGLRRWPGNPRRRRPGPARPHR